jgi:hypothetical protein
MFGRTRFSFSKTSYCLKSACEKSSPLESGDRVFIFNPLLSADSPMETLLADQTTSSDKMTIPSTDLFISQPVGGRNVCLVRSLSRYSGC